jgi:cyanate lyase
MAEKEAKAAAEKLGLDDDDVKMLMAPPYRGSPFQVPTDPFIYRFYEIMQVYGQATREVAQEEFGDGIMSAIDFTLNVDRVEDPKGDRVRITLEGKFLPYKKF